MLKISNLPSKTLWSKRFSVPKMFYWTWQRVMLPIGTNVTNYLGLTFYSMQTWNLGYWKSTFPRRYTLHPPLIFQSRYIFFNWIAISNWFWLNSMFTFSRRSYGTYLICLVFICQIVWIVLTNNNYQTIFVNITQIMCSPKDLTRKKGRNIASI